MASFNFNKRLFTFLVCGVSRAVFVAGGNVGIHHWLDGFLLGFAVVVKVIVIHIKGAVTFKAEPEPLSKHHSLRVFELVIGIPQTGVKFALQRELIQAVSELEQCLANAEQDNIDLRAFLSIIRKCTDLKEQTPELVNRLITKIEILIAPRTRTAKRTFLLKHTSSVWVFLKFPTHRQLLRQKKKSARIRQVRRKREIRRSLNRLTPTSLAAFG